MFHQRISQRYPFVVIKHFYKPKNTIIYEIKIISKYLKFKKIHVHIFYSVLIPLLFGYYFVIIPLLFRYYLVQIILPIKMVKFPK